MRVGFIGTGEIAAAMVQGLAGRGHDILVSERNAEMAATLAKALPEVTIASNAGVVAGSDVVFLCLMADVAREVLPDLAFRANHSVISVMVDVPVAELQRLCAPATDIALTIPLSAVATGGSMLPVFPSSAALTALFGKSDTVFSVQSEHALNAHFAGTALSAPFLDLMRTGAHWLGRETGDAAAAEAYVRGIFAGFMNQMAQDSVGFDPLLKSLATEGGLNDSLKSHMRKAGTHEVLETGLDALKLRLGL
ncbi:MAG: NAD(P)-binding domain-containing protein [Sulfitobacter sp.]